MIRVGHCSESLNAFPHSVLLGAGVLPAPVTYEAVGTQERRLLSVTGQEARELE